LRSSSAEPNHQERWPDKERLTNENKGDCRGQHQKRPRHESPTILPRSGQSPHQVYGNIDHSSKFLNIEAGVGSRLTGASDKLSLKRMLSRDLN
jgi:hypothetical protein